MEEKKLIILFGELPFSGCNKVVNFIIFTTRNTLYIDM